MSARFDIYLIVDYSRVLIIIQVYFEIILCMRLIAINFWCWFIRPSSIMAELIRNIILLDNLRLLIDRELWCHIELQIDHLRVWSSRLLRCWSDPLLILLVMSILLRITFSIRLLILVRYYFGNTKLLLIYLEKFLSALFDFTFIGIVS